MDRRQPIFRRIRSRVHTKHGYGRHALFKAEIMRKEPLANRQDRDNRIIYQENLALKQRQADTFHELNRVEGMLSNHIPLQQRAYALRRSLGPAAVAEGQ